MLMYCDDPIILCVGPDMTHEALKVWTWMAAEDISLLEAIAAVVNSPSAG